MLTSKRFFLVRRAALLLAILIGFACGADDSGEFFSLFQPQAATYPATDSRYIFTPLLYNDSMFGMDDTHDTLSDQVNTAAWVAYLGNAYSTQQVREALADTTANNTLLNQLERTQSAAATYLRLAYAAQQAGGSGTPWEGTPPDTLQLVQLSAQARDAAQAATDPFLKERYAFQAVKLADQAGSFARSRDLYDQLVKSLPKRTFISDWARCRMAGSLIDLGEKDRAVFEFAQVFANCPTRRLDAERSLRHKGLRFSEQALSLAKNDAERVAVYAVCAIQPKQDALPLLEKMVELDPKNPLNELVLAREINRNEYFFAEKRFPGYVDGDQTRQDSVAFEDRRKNVPDYADKLLTFCQNAAKNTALGNPAYYLTAAAYLQYLNGDYNGAKTTLDEAGKVPDAKQALQQQIALQQMLLLAAQPDLPDATAETQLISYLTQFKQATEANTVGADEDPSTRFGTAIQTVGKQLADRYLTAGAAKSGGWLSGCSSKKTDDAAAGPRLAKAYLMRLLTTQVYGQASLLNGFDGQNELEDTTSLQTAQQLADYVARPANEFDERLVKLAGLDADYAQQLVGRRALAEGHYDVATQAFAQVKPAIWQSEAMKNNFAIDPFSVNMPGDGKPRNPYTPLQFAQRLVALHQDTETSDPARAAQAWYTLGCGAYNLTFFGNAWILARRFRSSAEMEGYQFQATETGRLNQFLNDPYYSASRAKDCFSQAAKLATNPELAAKATYMAALCEGHALAARRTIEAVKKGGYIADDDADFNAKMKQLADADYTTYLTSYRSQYQQTQFARQMQTRCALYRDFVSAD